MLPTVASAAVKQIVVNEASASYCIAVDNGPTAVTFTIRAPGGGVLRTKQVTTPTASQNCGGAATPGAESFTTTIDSYPGATVTADAGGGIQTTFPLPYAAYDASGGPATVKVKNMPSASGTILINGISAPFTGPAYTTPAPITIGSGAVDVESTVGSIPYSALLNAVQFSIEATYYGNVSVYGGDSLGAPIAVSVAVGGVQQQSTSMTPGVDDAQYQQADMPLPIPPGAVVTVAQPGWFTHAVTLGSISASVSGVSASIPAVAGETGLAYLDTEFQATSGVAPSSPLACLAFGDATHMLSQCGSSTARYATTFPLFFAAGDSASISVTEPDGDRASSQVTAGGFSVYLDSGSAGTYGLLPSAPVTLTATTPTQLSASTSAATYMDGNAYFGGEDGSASVPLKIVSGTTLTASGAAAGGAPRSGVANLEVHAAGTVIAGSTYPGGHLQVTLYRPTGGGTTVYLVADGTGAFAVDLGALLPRDRVSVYAADPTGATTCERDLYPGSPQPVIQGLADQQLVHGTVSAGALGGGPAGILWSGDGPGALAPAAPFAYSLDTTQLKDGPHRVIALAAGLYDAQSDYLWLRVDNTLPTVSAGPSQYVAIAHTAVLVPTAHDANGMASLSVSFGDGRSVVQPVAQIGQPIRHVYAKAGTFTETVVGTDVAGNVATSTAQIHVISKLSEQVAGNLPASFKQAKKLKKRKNLSVKLTAHMAGELHVQVLNGSSKVRASISVQFAAANAKATLTLPTKKWAKGRYTVVLQFTDATGSPGPLVVQALRIK